MWIPPWFSAGRAGRLPTPEGSRTNVCAALADFFLLPKATHYITGPQGLRQTSWWGKRERERERENRPFERVSRTQSIRVLVKRRPRSSSSAAPGPRHRHCRGPCQAVGHLPLSSFRKGPEHSRLEKWPGLVTSHIDSGASLPGFKSHLCHFETLCKLLNLFAPQFPICKTAIITGCSLEDVRIQ